MLSKKTKYGIKALIYLANAPADTPVAIQDISAAEQISRKFLESILLLLKKTGFLFAKKGKGGGYYLRKKPDEIPMAAIIRILEGPIALLPCVSLNFYEKCADCTNEDECSIHGLMIEVRDSALKVLENRTLADIAY